VTVPTIPGGREQADPLHGRPWLSVLIPTHNGQAFLRAALDSIIAQGESRIECIAVDDASTDGTIPILEDYTHRLPLTIRRHRRQGNWARSTNEALEAAQGEFITFLHQDDIWLGNRVAALRTLADRSPQARWFLTSAIFMDAIGRQVGRWRCPLPAWPDVIDKNSLLARLLVQNFVAIPAPVVARDLALRVGGLDECAWYTADWDFWLKLAALEVPVYYPTPTVAFRLHRHSQTNVRSSSSGDFRSQHTSVVERHFEAWKAPYARKVRVWQISSFSTEVNVALASVFHGDMRSFPSLFAKFLSLGLPNQFEYLRNSRIWERVLARIRVALR
jgi:glycosyltransferase involved in cell wall biosynthesis